MTIQEFYKKLKETMGIEVAYDHFNHAPSNPFIVYIDRGKTHFIADSKIYTTKTEIQIELYTQDKDLVLEGKLEKFLVDNFGVFEDLETIYIKEQDMYQHIYFIRL